MTSWDEPKRRKNIKVHGLDFEGADAIWDNFTVTRDEAGYYFETAEEYFRKDR